MENAQRECFYAKCRVAASILTLLVLVGGCNERRFLGETGVFALTINESTAPAGESEDGAFYVVEERAFVPIEMPTDDEFAALTDGSALPWPRRPWVTLDDYSLEVDWVVKNLKDSTSVVTITANGINEFHEYTPAFAIIDDDLVFDFSQYERTVAVEGLSSVSGTIRQQQLEEAAIDLSTVVNGAPNSNVIVNPESISSVDPRAIPFVPEVIAQLTGVRFGMRMAGEQDPNLIMEITVRVRDENDKVTDPEDAWMTPAAAVFAPIAPANE